MRGTPLAVLAIGIGLSCEPVVRLTISKPKPPGPPIFAGNVLQSPELIHYVRPRRPADTCVQGVVEFTAKIGKEGKVEQLIFLRGHPLLVSPAKEAVLKWRYKPFMLNGEPVEVITDILVNFRLNQ